MPEAGSALIAAGGVLRREQRVCSLRSNSLPENQPFLRRGSIVVANDRQTGKTERLNKIYTKLRVVQRLPVLHAGFFFF